MVGDYGKRNRGQVPRGGAGAGITMTVGFFRRAVGAGSGVMACMGFTRSFDRKAALCHRTRAKSSGAAGNNGFFRIRWAAANLLPPVPRASSALSSIGEPIEPCRRVSKDRRGERI